MISGGQIGTDLGAVEGARLSGIRTGGWCTVGFSTMRGPMPSLRRMYGMRAIERTSDMRGVGHRIRDQMNVDMCDILIAFLWDLPKTGRGTLVTCHYAIHKTARFNPKLVKRYDKSIDDKARITYFEPGKKRCRDLYKPTMIVVNLNDKNISTVAIAMKNFIQRNKAQIIMASGSAIDDSIYHLVKNVFMRTFQLF